MIPNSSIRKLPYEEVLDWAQNELKKGNRIKASRIYKAGMNMKERKEQHEREHRPMYFY